MLTEEEKYIRAKQKVAKMKRFYKHLSSWMFTSVFLMVVFFSMRMPPWITFIVIAGWGIGIAAEAIEVFGFPGTNGSWEERKIREEMDRMDGNQVLEIPGGEEDDDDTLELPDYHEVKRNWKDSDFV